MTTDSLALAILNAKARTTPVSQLIRALWVAELALPSGSPVKPLGQGFQPLLFNKHDVPMLACFSDKALIGEFIDMAPYCLTMKGEKLLRWLPSGHGLVINPGQEACFDISPEGIANIVKELGD